GLVLVIKLTQERQLLLDFTFQAAICRLVESGTQTVGEIMFARSVAVWLVMGITISPAVTQFFHELGGSVAQMHRHRRTAVLLGVTAGRLIGVVDRVGFGGTGQINHGLRKRQLALGRTEPPGDLGPRECQPPSPWGGQGDRSEPHAYAT